MITPWLPKAPGDTTTYTVDWADYGIEGPVSVAVATVTGATLVSQTHTPDISTISVSGGAAGTPASISFALTLASNPAQVLTRDFTLQISDQIEAIYPATTKKRAVVEMAFEEIGLAGFAFDATPEEYSSALRRLDALMAEWRTQSLDVGYNFPAVLGAGDLEDLSGLPDFAVNVVAIKLALRLMPSIGKTMSPETRLAMTEGMNAIRTTYARTPERTLGRNTPIGSGHRIGWYGWPFAGRA